MKKTHLRAKALNTGQIVRPTSSTSRVSIHLRDEQYSRTKNIPDFPCYKGRAKVEDLAAAFNVPADQIVGYQLAQFAQWVYVKGAKDITSSAVIPNEGEPFRQTEKKVRMPKNMSVNTVSNNSL